MNARECSDVTIVNVLPTSESVMARITVVMDLMSQIHVVCFPLCVVELLLWGSV